MTHFDLLNAVQPSSGWFAVLGIKGVDNTKQYLVETREEVDEITALMVQQERNVFFGVAKYTDGSGRKKSNVKAIKSFWLDIDCGPTKAVVNPKTKRPDGYIDQASGLAALQKFCRTIGLPKPILINSGRGLHVYWPLTTEVTREQWEPVAARLRELCVTHDLYVDPSVFEVSRVLRIPGTLNFKDNPASAVSVVHEGKPTDFDDFVNLLGIKPPSTEPLPAKRPLTALGKSLQDSIGKSFKRIMTRSAKGDGCQQLLDCYQNQTTISEPRWFDALSVAKFCDDADKSIHLLSNQHPDYDPGKTVQKIAHIEQPHNCVTFERNNPGGCAGCPHFGKIKNPITLGMTVPRATVADRTMELLNERTGEMEVITIPEYPKPFYRGKEGGIWREPFKDEGDPVFVYQHDLYVVKRMHDPVQRDVAVIRLHTPSDGVKEFIIPNNKVTDKAELRKILSGEGVMVGPKRFDLICDYLISTINTFQYGPKAELMRLQFGWADNDSKFIVGDKEVTVEGVFYSPPSSTTEQIAAHMGAVGTLEKWKEVFNIYGREGLEGNAFAALTAFGAPLLRFSGQSGAIINVIHPHSGTGKTTILHMCNSVWGHPKHLCTTPQDTVNASIMRLGVYNHLPYTVDEVTNMAPLAFSDFAYAMANGKGKERMEASGNKLRVNNTRWQTISLCSSNASFYEKLIKAKATPDGEMMRMLEYKIDYSDVLEVDYAKQMFDHQLFGNYGHAGVIYAGYLLKKKKEVVETFQHIQAKLDRELKLTQRERFWSAVIAANITGGLIAKELGLIDWDMRRIYKWATQMLLVLREDVQPPATDLATIIGDYLNRHMQNILVVNDNVDRRTQMPMLPQLEPKGELLVRYEPDTHRMYIAAKHFKNDCVDMQINYKETLNQLKKQGIFLKPEVKRLSKGMKVITPGVYSLVFDTSVNGFLNIDGLVGIDSAEQTNESGGD
jgi:hypothetical protein